jgi:hypothetical protein
MQLRESQEGRPVGFPSRCQVEKKTCMFLTKITLAVHQILRKLDLEASCSFIIQKYSRNIIHLLPPWTRPQRHACPGWLGLSMEVVYHHRGFVVISLWFGKLAMERVSSKDFVPLHGAITKYRGSLLASAPPCSTEPVHWDVRRDRVQKTFLHAWTGYKARAFPGDELRAVSGGSTNQYVEYLLSLCSTI